MEKKAVNKEKEERAKKELKVLSKYIRPNNFLIKGIEPPTDFFHSLKYRISKKDFVKAGKDLGYWKGINEETIYNYLNDFYKEHDEEVQKALKSYYNDIKFFGDYDKQEYRIIKEKSKYIYYEDGEDMNGNIRFIKREIDKDIGKEQAKIHLNEIEKAGKYKEDLKREIDSFIKLYETSYYGGERLNNVIRYEDNIIFYNMQMIIDCMKQIQEEFDYIHNELKEEKDYINTTLTQKQIKYLCKELNNNNLFQGTLKQWQNVFSKNVQLAEEPIKLLLTADYLQIFFELLIKREYIKIDFANCKYIIENNKLFANKNGNIYTKHLISNQPTNKRLQRVGEKPIYEKTNYKEKEKEYISLEHILDKLKDIH